MEEQQSGGVIRQCITPLRAGGQQLVTASADRTVALWDVRRLTGAGGGGYRAALVTSFRGHKDPVAALSLHRGKAV